MSTILEVTRHGTLRKVTPNESLLRHITKAILKHGDEASPFSLLLKLTLGDT